MAEYDIIVIGAGPGGYVAAIRAAQLGAKVALIEKNQVGGVCLNRGCIPTKAMIASAHMLGAVKRAQEFGVACSGLKIDMKKVRERKDAVVSTLRDGVAKLLKGNGVEVINGTAAFKAQKKLEVNGAEIEAKNILIAAGSSWIQLPNLKTDGRFIVTSDEALSWESVPKRLLIVGGGVVGCEFACMMREFGSEVTIVEAFASILPPVEKAISRLLARSMKSAGIEILTDTKVESANVQGEEVGVKLSSGAARTADIVLVAIGRRALTSDLNLKAAGVNVNMKGFISVDANFKTSAEGTYAIGDIIGNPMLAHAASAEGIACVEGIFGKGCNYEPLFCPSPIFTTPEIGSVGATSEELEKKGVVFKTGRFPYAASGKALCDGESEGQAVIYADESGKILGVHVIGKDATLIIAEAALAMKNGLTIENLASTIHSHPTLSEILCEAAEDCEGRAIHKTVSSRIRKLGNS